MGDPVGIVSLGITLIQGGYKAYQTYKLTEAFGNDFRSAQRRLEGQMMLLRWESYRLRQITVSGQIANRRDHEHLLRHIETLLGDIRVNVQKCQRLAKKYLSIQGGPSTEPKPADSQPLAANVITPPSGAQVVTVQGDPTKGSNTTVSNVPRKSRSLHGFFRFFNPRNTPASKPESRKHDVSNAHTQTQNAGDTHSVDQELQSVPSVLGETRVLEKAKAQIEISKTTQKSAKGKLRFKWVVNDRDEYEACLELIEKAVRELSDLLAHYFNKQGTTTNRATSRHGLRGYKNVAHGREISSSITSEYTDDIPMEAPSIPVNQFDPLGLELYLCQETFHQLYSDIQNILSEDVCVKLYYNHFSTWKDFRPYQGVNVRKSSIVFLFQTRIGRTSNESILVVADAPICDSKSDHTENEAGVQRLLTHSLTRGPTLDSLRKAVNLDTTASEHSFCCLGSVNMALPYVSLVPEKVLNSFDGKRASEQDASNPYNNYRIHSHGRAVIAPDGDSNLNGPKLSTEKPNKTKAYKKHNERTPKAATYQLFTNPLFHHIYQDQSCVWAQQTSLETLLRDDSLRKEEFAEAHQQLALLLAMSSVSLGFEGKGRIIRPAECLFYRPSEDPGSDVHEDMILAPFLRLKPEPLVQVGSKGGIPPTRRQTMIELGLLLYQIGSWKSINYQHPKGIHGLIREAMADLEAVVSHLGRPFSRIVRNCLEDWMLPFRYYYIPIRSEYIKQWPRYGTEDDHQMVLNQIRAMQKGGPQNFGTGFALQTPAPANEIIEIWNLVIAPLKHAIQHIAVIEDERNCIVTQTRLPTIQAIQDRTRRPDLETTRYREASAETLSTSEGPELQRVRDDGIRVVGNDGDGDTESDSREASVRTFSTVEGPELERRVTESD